MTTFQFYVRDIIGDEKRHLATPNETLLGFLELTEPKVLEDTFGGAELMGKIWREMSEDTVGDMTSLYFCFQMLLIRLAQSLDSKNAYVMQEKTYSPEDFSTELIEFFFIKEHANPDCCREQLAGLLSISVRQLTRLLERLYHKTFSAILMEYRMYFAESYLQESHYTAAENARAVGFETTRGFLMAYQKFFGREYGICTNGTK